MSQMLQFQDQTSKHLPALTSAEVRKIILQQSKRANVGHIGSSLSIVEILHVLYEKVLNIPSLQDPDRDRFILSKGHAALALYAVLHLKGFLDQKTLDTYCQDGSSLGVHPEAHLEGIDFSTGSLGHGLSIGCGAALAAKIAASNRKVHVLLSDAELNEGSIWEAIMFATQHQLGNLTVVLDNNQQQALGYTKDIMNLSPVARKWEAFGWHTQDVDGHDLEALTHAYTTCLEEQQRPSIIVANTTFGKGVSYMEKKISWHYMPMNDEEFQQAMREVEKNT